MGEISKIIDSLLAVEVEKVLTVISVFIMVLILIGYIPDASRKILASCVTSLVFSMIMWRKDDYVKKMEKFENNTHGHRPSNLIYSIDVMTTNAYNYKNILWTFMILLLIFIWIQSDLINVLHKIATYPLNITRP